MCCDTWFPFFNVGSGRSNSEPTAYQASTLLTEVHPVPHLVFLKSTDASLLHEARVHWAPVLIGTGGTEKFAISLTATAP